MNILANPPNLISAFSAISAVSVLHYFTHFARTGMKLPIAAILRVFRSSASPKSPMTGCAILSDAPIAPIAGYARVDAMADTKELLQRIAALRQRLSETAPVSA